jgi:hypothetical protein
MAKANLLVSDALLSLSGKCHTKKHELQHPPSFHTTNISVSSLDIS